MNFLITGGAGFIGSAVCRHLIRETNCRIINLDALTYAGNLSSLDTITENPRYRFVQGDIADGEVIGALLREEEINIVMHLAAESHVDRSIDTPVKFIQTNIVGTYELLEAVRKYYACLPEDQRKCFRFHHISTDEVYGQLPLEEGVFNENTPYAPTSPYSASKAASDHLVRAWHHTYRVPVVLSNCSNNYGPYQYPEKLIPLTILNAMEFKPVTVYGTGKNIRDWLYVDDHVRALTLVATRGVPGRSYNIGGRGEQSNIQVVRAVCDLLDQFMPISGSGSRRQLIQFLADRPGHDLRYAIDPSRIEAELEWKALETFDTGLEKTVRWYLDNESWWEPIRRTGYRGERIGMAVA